jgi:hypothetical protein
MILVLFNSYTADKYIPNPEIYFSYFASIKYESIPEELHCLLITVRIGFFKIL